MDQTKEILEQLEHYKAMGVDLSTIQTLAQSAYGSGTTTLGLNRWSLSDKPTMEDFNRDNEILDQEIRELREELAHKANETDMAGKLNRTGDTLVGMLVAPPNTLYLGTNEKSGGALSLGTKESDLGESITIGMAQNLLRFHFRGDTVGFHLDFTKGARGASTSIWHAGGDCVPDADNAISLGSAGRRLKDIYCASGTIQTSDAGQKETIAPLKDDTMQAFLAALEPVSYRYQDGTSGRTHYGLVAQQVEEAMFACGITDMDFAGLIKSPELDEDGQETGEHTYGLRYTEFIPILLKVVQGLLRRVAALEHID